MVDARREEGPKDGYYGVVFRYSDKGNYLLSVSVDGFLEVGLFAEVHFLLPGARVAALTAGNDDLVLVAALGAGATALHRLDTEPDILCGWYGTQLKG